MSYKTYNELKNYMLSTIMSSINKRRKKIIVKKKKNKKTPKKVIDLRVEEELRICREEVLNGYKTIRK